MKKNISILFALIGWFAIIMQYILMIDHRTASITETTIRFFSFFTILTNTMVAIYFSYQGIKANISGGSILNKPGTLTALTIYITIVSLIYQLILRQTWHPEGLDRVVDELLHTIIPIFTIIYWFAYENKKDIPFNVIPKWLIYPATYLVFILTRGHFSNFYPYPFVDVLNLGIRNVLINSAALILFFVFMSVLYIFIGKRISKIH